MSEIERYYPADGRRLHRCPICWMDGPNADRDNGFVSEDVPLVHSRFCGNRSPLPVVRPAVDAPEGVRRLFSKVAPGSACVVVQRGGAYYVYYEGGIYSRRDREPTEEEREEYAKVAAGRAVENYPTVAFFGLTSMEGLEVVGEVDVARGYAVRFF